tara:strand:+ start:451 stop:2226 length:1776 start_codon:yes stop_codon:yes gene_type:complete
MATKPTHTLNHPGGGYQPLRGYQPIAEKAIPKPQQMSLRNLMKIASYIHVDPKLMQRLFIEWEDERVDSFLVSLYDGTGRCTSLVMAEVQTVLESLKSIKDSNGTTENLDRSIEVFQKISDKNQKYVLLDGQHRFNHLVRWIQPKNADERYYPSSEELDALFANHYNDKDELMKKPDYCKITDKSFTDLPTEVQDYFLNAIIPIIMFTSGDLKIIQKAFKVVNSSTMPKPMTIRMMSMSPVVDFLRDMVNPTSKVGDISIRRFLDCALSGESGDKKAEHNGHEKLITTLLGWVSRNKHSNWNTEDGLDDVCDYTSKVTKSSMNDVRDTFYELASAFVEAKGLEKKTRPIKILPKKKVNWSNIMNLLLFTYSLQKGKFEYLKNFKDDKGFVKPKIAKVENNKEFVEFVTKMIQDITSATDWIYFDKNGEATTDIEEAEMVYDKDLKRNVPVIATITKTIGTNSKTEKLKNPHGFRGHSEVTADKQFSQRLDMMEEYFNEHAEDLRGRRVITLVDKSHSKSDKETLFTGVQVQKYNDSYSDDVFSAVELAEMDDLSDNHFGDNHSEGGSKTLVGNATINKKLGAKKVEPSLNT